MTREEKCFSCLYNHSLTTFVLLNWAYNGCKLFKSLKVRQNKSNYLFRRWKPSHKWYKESHKEKLPPNMGPQLLSRSVLFCATSNSEILSGKEYNIFKKCIIYFYSPPPIFRYNVQHRDWQWRNPLLCLTMDQPGSLSLFSLIVNNIDMVMTMQVSQHHLWHCKSINQWPHIRMTKKVDKLHLVLLCEAHNLLHNRLIPTGWDKANSVTITTVTKPVYLTIFA